MSQESTCLVGRIVTRVGLSHWSSFCGSSCHGGRVITRIELSQGSSCHEGRVVHVELSQGSSYHKDRVVTRVELSMSSCHKGRDDLGPVLSVSLSGLSPILGANTLDSLRILGPRPSTRCKRIQRFFSLLICNDPHLKTR